jgi:acetyl-CoA decarbonylase/synthase complex subunit gamma
VEPGLYAVGTPDANAPVLVSANYKLSFDVLRRELAGRDVFVLVLQTLGINVWCAAGKGTFGTAELSERIASVGLEQVVSHRRVIVPQLGAPGVAAHAVRARTGFRVVYGPVSARDLPKFLDDGLRATPEMRRKRFPLRERAALVPMELVPSLKYGVPLVALLALLAGLLGPGAGFLENALRFGGAAGASVLLGILCGAVLTPLLLPAIPGRAFAAKGALVGCLLGVPGVLLVCQALTPLAGVGWLSGAGLAAAGLAGLTVALSSFLGMSFTGSSTYASLSGVEREMRVAVPAQAVLTVTGLGAWIAGLLLWG